MRAVNLLMLLVAATTARAEQQLPNGAVVGELSYQGDGCPEGSLEGQAAENGTYGMVFTAMQAVGQNPGMTQVSCTMSVPVRLPRHLRMSIDGVLVEGQHRAPAGTKTSLCTKYSFVQDQNEQGTDWWFYNINVSEADRSKQFSDMNDQPGLDFFADLSHGLGTREGNFGATMRNRPRLGGRTYFSSCGQEVRFDGMLVLMAERSQGASAAPEIAVQRFDTQQRYNLGWAWRFERCPNPYEGYWDLSWRDLNGINRRSRLSFRHGGGSIAGHGIVLEQVVYDADYIRGRWRHQSGPAETSGWFRLAAPLGDDDPNRPGVYQRFGGEWGMGKFEGENSLGDWQAVRLGD